VGSCLPVAAATVVVLASAVGVFAEALSFALVLLTGHAIAVARDVDGGSLALHLIVVSVEEDGLPFVEGLEAVLVDAGEVDKQVFAAVSGLDKSKSLLGEELHGALLGHFVVWFSFTTK